MIVGRERLGRISKGAGHRTQGQYKLFLNRLKAHKDCIAIYRSMNTIQHTHGKKNAMMIDAIG